MMMTRNRSRSKVLAAAAFALVLGLGACGGGDDDGAAVGNGDDGGGGGGPELPDCPVDALDQATGPVEIEFWHAMTRANKDELERLTRVFNESQSRVRVTLSESPSYADNFTRYKSALATGALPDLVQIEDTGLQQMIDSRSVLPAAACVQADDYDTSDHIDRVLAYYTVQDVLWPMPFNVSNPILYYNKKAFRAAGLDPEAPPRDLEEVREAAQAIVDRGTADYGLAFKTDAWFFEHWTAMSGRSYVNNGNGRERRATEVLFDDEEGVAQWEWLQEMYRDELLLSTGDADIDHYLAVAEGKAAMTIDTSAALGTIFQLLSQYPDVELGAAPMPGPVSEDGGVLVGGAALYIVNRSDPVEQAAAWEFAKFLNEAQTQAEWSAATGYIPIRESAIDLPPIIEAWRARPELRIAYDQLLSGADNEATAGPVIGAYGSAGGNEGVRGAIVEGLNSMFVRDVPAADALAQAAQKADQRIQEYNSRVG